METTDTKHPECRNFSCVKMERCMYIPCMRVSDAELCEMVRANQIKERPMANASAVTDTAELSKAIAEFEAALPGWWWSVCHCALTRDASCGPDFRVLGVDHPHVKAFDDGFHDDNPGTLADALRAVLHLAKEAVHVQP